MSVLPELLHRTHMMGIGGAGMSGIARILLARGSQVSGSDAKESLGVQELRAQGARIGIGQKPENLDAFDGDPSVIVVSSAIKDADPELAAARERGIPVIHRSKALALLMAGRRSVAITGTHGKTSTTSMLTVALQQCELDPSFSIGGNLVDSGVNAHHGTGEIFVSEVDESDGSFLAFSPSVAIVMNVEADHLDHYGTAEAYMAAFDTFLERIEDGGLLVVCSDDDGAEKLAATAEKSGIRVHRYGRSVSGPNDAKILSYVATENGGTMVISLAGKEISVSLTIPGEHMALNAVAALLAGVELGAPVEGLVAGLAGFGGARRRFEFKGAVGGVRVYDDYAHHPTEVSTQLRSFRPTAGSGRIVAVFQPHMYSRTQIFATEFAEALNLADVAVVLDVFGAREEPQPGITGDLIAKQISGAVTHYEPVFGQVAKLVAELARPGDLVVTMGAGDVTQLGPEILAELTQRGALA